MKEFQKDRSINLFAIDQKFKYKSKNVAALFTVFLVSMPTDEHATQHGIHMTSNFRVKGSNPGCKFPNTPLYLGILNSSNDFEFCKNKTKQIKLCAIHSKYFTNKIIYRSKWIWSNILDIKQPRKTLLASTFEANRSLYFHLRKKWYFYTCFLLSFLHLSHQSMQTVCVELS